MTNGSLQTYTPEYFCISKAYIGYKMKNAITAVAMAATVALFSCHKQNHEMLPENKITVSQPVPGQVYHANDTVHITGIVSGNTSLHGYEVAILNATGDSLFHTYNHTHASSIDVSEEWVNTQAMPGSLRIIITSAINHEGDNLTKEVPILVQ